MHSVHQDFRDGGRQRVWAVRQDGIHVYAVDETFLEKIDTDQDKQVVDDGGSRQRSISRARRCGIQSSRRHEHPHTQGVSDEK